MSSTYLNVFTLFFSLLNPFLLSIYMIAMIRHEKLGDFVKGLIQGSIIAFCVFMLFAWGGEAIFTKYLNLRFESFQIFGGFIFLIIGFQYVFQGAEAIGKLRDPSISLAGTVAMPYLIGPGTISAGVVAGMTLPIYGAVLIIGLTLAINCIILSGIKFSHDYLKNSYAVVVDRYFDIVGRISALLIGTIALDMIVSGVLGLIKNYK